MKERIIVKMKWEVGEAEISRLSEARIRLLPKTLDPISNNEIRLHLYLPKHF